jgi:gamma-glutamylcyclotransferase (GGCT)/AIG2-like uncharacterized protein YtfP
LKVAIRMGPSLTAAAAEGKRRDAGTGDRRNRGCAGRGHGQGARVGRGRAVGGGEARRPPAPLPRTGGSGYGKGMPIEPPRRTDRRLRRLVIVLVAAFVASAGVYFTQIQPGALAYLDPIDIVVPEEPGPHRLFVYGTLRSPIVRFVVTGRVRPAEPATLPGFRRIERNIISDAEAEVEGYVVHVSTSELRRLDRYERTGQVYERVELTLEDGEPAWVYRMLPST